VHAIASRGPAGRADALPTAATHFVNGAPLERPYPQGSENAIFGLGCYCAITTEILPAPTFYFAEDYHQQYLAKNPHGYCGLGGPARSALGSAPRFRSGKIDGVALEVAELHDLKRRFVCRGENDPRCAPSLKGLAPARGTQAPAVARLKARKTEFG